MEAEIDQILLNIVNGSNAKNEDDGYFFRIEIDFERNALITLQAIRILDLRINLIDINLMRSPHSCVGCIVRSASTCQTR